MENKNVGLLIVGIAVVMIILILIFNNVVRTTIGLSCSHGPECGMYNAVNVQTWISLAIIGVIIVIGLVIMFSKPREKIIIKKIKEKRRKINLDNLDKDEKKVVKLLEEENGAIFQRTLMEKLEIGKVGMTRLLDKLEAKQIIERKRRGMNNIVVLKNS